jgi:hypothetical protein
MVDRNGSTGPVRAANALTARWARTWDGGSTVLSGAGVWPLLAALQGGASGTTLTELTTATGLPDDGALAGARELWEVLGGAADVRAALGLWWRAELELRAAWVAGLPAGSRGELSGEPKVDQDRLDEWVAERTGGLLEQMPVRVTSRTLLVLASALTVRTGWARRFQDGPLRAADGPWRELGELAGLRRSGTDLDEVAVLDTPVGPVTALAVRGAGDVDVHLLMGEPERAPGEILSAGLAALPTPQPPGGPGSGGPGSGMAAGSAAGPMAGPEVGGVRWGSGLGVGAVAPGVRVVERPSFSGEPGLVVRCVRFRVGGEHDLLAEAELFGLGAASDEDTAEFPGISGSPLMVSAARQDAVATFSATGFEAAAVTGMAMTPTAAPAGTARTVEVTLDRPYGFAAVHRPSGLVLVAGWVGEPERASAGRF